MTISTQRASLYDNFAALYARECSSATLAKLNDQHNPWDFLRVLSSLAPEAFERLQVALEPIAGISPDDALLELRADFTHAFLLDPKVSAVPYAGFYLTTDGEAKQLYGKTEEQMRRFLGEQALAIHPDFPEPADHLAVLLATAASLARKEAPLDVQHDFILGALNSWLPAFSERCQQLGLRFDFYPALAPLLAGFVALDVAFLRESAPTASAQG